MSNMKHNMEHAMKELEQAQIELSHNNMDSNKIRKVKTCTEEMLKLHGLE